MQLCWLHQSVSNDGKLQHTPLTLAQRCGELCPGVGRVKCIVCTSDEELVRCSGVTSMPLLFRTLRDVHSCTVVHSYWFVIAYSQTRSVK